MHMMFVDESGDTGYPHDGDWTDWKGSTHFARVGVIIHGWKWKAWNDKLTNFKKNRGLTWDVEIKAAHLRKGQGFFAGWERERRYFFLRNLAELIGGNCDMTLIGVIIDKTKIDHALNERLARPEVRSLELLLERYNRFLDQQDDKAGVVILDPTKDSNDDNLRYFQSYLAAHSKNLRPLRIVEGTFFAKSHTSNMIQVADVCTHIFYRQHTKEPGTLGYKEIEPRFWMDRALGQAVISCP